MLRVVHNHSYLDGVEPLKINIDGEEIVAREVAFHVVDDGSVSIELENGATLRLKHIVVKVVRAEEKTSEGDPMYMVQSITRVTVVKPGKEDPQ